MSYFEKFIDGGLIQPPKFIQENLVFESVVGSRGNNTHNENSDTDLYGIFCPPREMVFPYWGIKHILHFGMQPEKCLQFNPKGKNEKINYNGQDYEITVYNIVRFFDLCMECNPNILGFLFSDNSSVTHQTFVAHIFRSNRHLFLHKGLFHKFCAYAMSQKNSITTNKRTGNRKELHEKYGFDCKFAGNSLRLLFEVEQLLQGDLDIKRDCVLLKAVRNGEVPLEDILKMFDEKKSKCDILFGNSKLPQYPNEELIKALLLKCLDVHWEK